MTNSLGFTQGGLDLALDLKHKYQQSQPLIAPGGDKLLMPELLLNTNIDLQDYDDPLPLAMVATRDPDSPLSVAAAVRMSPFAGKTRLTSEVFSMLGGLSKHPVVKQMVEMVKESHFDPVVISKVQSNAHKFVALSRKRYTEALRNNLKLLLEGEINPRSFVTEFFELSEAGNLRIDIRKRLVLGILKSESVRPSIKFLFMEQIGRLPETVQREIITEALNAPDKPSLEAIKKELSYIRLELVGGKSH
ncbi:MAG: hypothetical protein HQ503_14240 [Rhodospirillales bacterium]|nr:hypothetical protein [Rhodospirillales bacterium]